MINVNDVYEAVKSLLRKNQQGYLTPSEFIRYANISNKSRFNEIYGRPQTIINGKQTRESYAESQQIDEKLSIYLVSAVSQSVDSGGKIDKPVGLLRMASIKHNNGGVLVKVRRRNQDQEADMASSVVMPPTAEYPFYVDYGTYYQIYPKNIGDVDWSYLASPVDVVWAYTLDDRDRPIYDPDNSVDFQLEDSEIGNIIAKILVYAGKSVGDVSAIQLGSQQQITGE